MIGLVESDRITHILLYTHTLLSNNGREIIFALETVE